MAVDVVPALNAKIETSFKGNVMKDRRAITVSKRIRDGTATFKDAHTYAQSLGESLSKALVDTLTEDNLPNGTLYYNIAERTVIPALENNYKLVNEATDAIQKIQDKKNKIGLGSVSADFPTERIQGLIDKMTADDITLEGAVRWLMEPIVNNSEAFVDDYIRDNAKFRSDVGLKATITRTAEAKCCDWCADKEGTWDYDKAPPDVYQRHEFCRCVVTYQSQKTSQDVWSKRTWESTPDEIDRRKSAGESPSMSPQERINQAERLERDSAISDFEKQTGYNRRTAGRATLKKDPDEVQAEINKIIERRKRIGR